MQIDIFIPTRNRLSFLKETVASLLDAIQELGDRGRSFRVCLADGESDDGTAPWLDELEKSTPSVFIDRSPDRSLFQRMRRSAENSTADYIWFFGDDDVLAPGALEKVLLHLNSHDSGAVILNYSVWNATFTEVEVPDIMATKQLDHRRAEGLAASLGQTIGFFSCLIGRRKLLSEAMNFPAEFQSTLWPPVPWILWATKQRGLSIVPEKILLQRGANSVFGRGQQTWHNVFVFEWAKACQIAENFGYSKRDVTRLVSAPLNDRSLTFLRIVGERVNEIPQPEHLGTRLSRLYWNVPQFWLRVFPAFLIPVSLLKKGRSLKRRIVGA